MENLRKRNGKLVKFNKNKIKIAVLNAMKSVGEENKKTADKIANTVSSVLEVLYKNDRIPTVENVQDLVEKILIEAGDANIAKAYILYREQHSKIRETKNVIVDVQKTMGEYLRREDWRVNANSNQGYSLGGLILNTSGKVTANYWLSHIYSKEIGNAHRNSDFYIHDLDMFSGYCAGWSLRSLLQEGLGGVKNKIASAPPKHFETAIAQMVNFLGTLQNEWAGAQAFSSFDTYLAPFVRKIKLEILDDIEEAGHNMDDEKKEKFLQKKTYKRVKQCIQQFVFNLNVPSRWGTQTPFTNITLDWVCPDDMKDTPAMIAGKEQGYNYGDLKEEMEMINKAYLEVVCDGDANGRVFTFPIPTYNITKDFDWEDEKTDLLFEVTAKYGMPYFQNFINSDLDPSMVRSMCCRLQLDLNELKMRGNGLFGSAEMTGSLGVVTINMARLGYRFKNNKKALFKELEKLMELAKSSLETKRKVVQKNIDSGLLPFTKRYLPSLRNHFSTIGINGLNECIRNFTGDKTDISENKGIKFAKDVLEFMRNKMKEFQKETGNLYNLEATPAEGTTYRLAKEDKKKYKDIIQAGTEDAPYYTNSSQLPVNFTHDPFEALDKQDELQTLYTGGTVLHLYLGERISDSVACKNFVKKVLTNYKLPYITITPTFSMCPKHGYIAGEHKFCPKCDKELIAKKRIENKKKLDYQKNKV